MTLRFSRREFVLGTAALAAQAAVPPFATAQSAPLSPAPTVDTLVMKVITDSSYDTPRVGTSKWVKVRRVGLGAPGNFRKTLHNEWGLALALESRKGAESRQILLDFGWTPAALMNNMEIMGVDPAKAQALIASHGHFDHYGGLIGFLEKHRSSLPPDITLYIGGEDLFCRRKAGGAPGGHLTDAGWLDRRDLERLKIKVVTCEKPTPILGHAFTTGHITRRGFETVIPSQLVEYYPSDGIGCSIPEANAKAGGKPVKDDHIHEHGTCYNIKDRGLVVISSCGHSGIINTTYQAMEASGIKKVHAMVGGFHLFPADEAYVKKTVEAMKQLNPDVIIPMHCSGPTLLALLRSEMSDRVVASTNGTEYTFGA